MEVLESGLVVRQFAQLSGSVIVVTDDNGEIVTADWLSPGEKREPLPHLSIWREGRTVRVVRITGVVVVQVDEKNVPVGANWEPLSGSGGGPSTMADPRLRPPQRGMRRPARGAGQEPI